MLYLTSEINLRVNIINDTLYPNYNSLSAVFEQLKGLRFLTNDE